MSTITVNRFLDAVGSYLKCNLAIDSTFDESLNVLSKKYTNKKSPTITVGESLEPSQAGVFKFVRNELGRPEIHIGFNGAAPTIIINEDRCTINGEEPNGCECVPPDPTYLEVTGYKQDGTGPMADIGRFRISNSKLGDKNVNVGFHYIQNNGYVEGFATLDDKTIQINKNLVLTEGLAIYRGGFRFWSPAEEATATIEQSGDYIKLSNLITTTAKIQSLRLVDSGNTSGDGTLIYRKTNGEVMIADKNGKEFILNQPPIIDDSNYAKIDGFASLVAADATIKTLTARIAALEEVIANYRTVLEQLLDDHNLEDTDPSDSLKFSIGVKQVATE